MRWLRALRNPTVLLVLVPIAALVTLSYVGPGASEPLHDGPGKSDEPATTVVPVDTAAASQAAPAAAGADVPNPNWSATYDGTAASSRRSPVAVAAASADRSTTTIGAGPVAPLAAAAAEVPPEAVVDESSSPIVLILVAVGVVLVGLGGVTFWRRRRATA